MKILIITGPLYPNVGNNANLLGKLLPYLSENNEIRLLSPAYGYDPKALPQCILGYSVHWVSDSARSIKRRLIYPILSGLSGASGYDGTLGAYLIRDAARNLYAEFPYDAIIVTMQPYAALLAAAMLDTYKLAYVMDPFKALLDGETGICPAALSEMDCIFTTPFIREALLQKGPSTLEAKIHSVGFPHIEPHTLHPTDLDLKMDPHKINLLYSGALYPEIRSPKIFLDVIHHLDERFHVYFIGRGCEEFWSKYCVETKASVSVSGPLPYQAALNAIEAADILINIGNNMHVHMPSKTLEYINSGKPIINFHKYADCPTLYYTKRYPLCMNILEPTFNEKNDVAAIMDYCRQNKENRVDRAVIEQLYLECTPQAIAKQFQSQLIPSWFC